MEGAGAIRFCRLCHKNVHDLSAMTEDEAGRFLAAGGQPCMRYTFDGEGRVLFADRPRPLLPRLAAAAALTLGGLAVGGCVMGKKACPAPAEPGAEVQRGDPGAAAPAGEPGPEPADAAAPDEATPDEAAAAEVPA